MKKITIKNTVLYISFSGLVAFSCLQFIKDLSPQDTLAKIYNKLFVADEEVFVVSDQFPWENVGLYRRLFVNDVSGEPISREDVIRVFGVHVEGFGDGGVVEQNVGSGQYEGTHFQEGVFESYDSVAIPFLEIFPRDFDSNMVYPTVVLFSGHGSMRQVAFDETSYQGGLGVLLSEEGFLVFVMENRGMGKLVHLGDHMRIDAVARMLGGSWYGEITTDALWCIEMANQRNYSGKLGVGGVSTGGALSLLTSALDVRIVASYVQGYLGSYKTTFGSRGNHHECNNISNIIGEFDMDDIAKMIYPRSAVYVNGQLDGFYAEDAASAFESIEKRYMSGGHPDKVAFHSPAGVGHELSTSLALEYFKSVLIDGGE